MKAHLAIAVFTALLLASEAAAQTTPPPLGAPKTAPPPATAAAWYFASDGAPQGPFALEVLRARALAPDTMVWRQGMADWTVLALVPELASPAAPPAVAAGPPPAVPPPLAQVPTTPAATAAAPPDTTAYFVAEAGGPSEALSRDGVAERLRAGTIDRATLVWFEGLDGWRPLAETRLSALVETPVGPGAIAPEGFDASAHMRGNWQARVAEVVDGLAAPIAVDYTFSFAEGGRLTGTGNSLLDLRSQGIPEPIPLEVAVEGNWSVEALDDRRLRLRTAGSARTTALDTVETEGFEETTTLDIVDRNTLRDEDGNTLHRIGE
jgi:hypothetical protein